MMMYLPVTVARMLCRLSSWSGRRGVWSELPLEAHGVLHASQIADCTCEIYLHIAVIASSDYFGFHAHLGAFDDIAVAVERLGRESDGSRKRACERSIYVECGYLEFVVLAQIPIGLCAGVDHPEPSWKARGARKR